MTAAGLVQALLSALLCSAVTGSDLFVEAQQDVALPCDQVAPGQQNCDRTTWVYSDPRSTASTREIYSLGKASGFDFSRSFSLARNCSLLISEVQMKDAGLYSCRQFDRSDRQLSAASVSLTVVKVSEYVDEDEVERRCLVSSPLCCRSLRPKWLLNGTELRTERLSVGSEFLCETVLSDPRPQFSRAPNTELFTCELTHRTRKHSFRLRPQPAVLSQVPDVFVEDQAAAVLTCDGVQDAQLQCERTSWELQDSQQSETRPIFTLGQTRPITELPALNLTENCSLEINKVTSAHSGSFTCRQFDGLGREASARLTTLSVVLLIEFPFDGAVRLFSSVASPHGCDTFRGRWLYGGRALTAGQHLSRTSERTVCVGAVSFSEALFSALQKEQLTWELSHRDQRQTFRLPPEPPGLTVFSTVLLIQSYFIPVDTEVTGLGAETAPEATGACGTEEDTSEVRAKCDESGACAVGLWFLVLKAVSWSALICATVVVSIYTRQKEKTLSKDEADHPMSLRQNPGNAAAQADYVNQR